MQPSKQTQHPEKKPLKEPAGALNKQQMQAMGWHLKKPMVEKTIRR